jgi:PilZ domain-containing protein
MTEIIDRRQACRYHSFDEHGIEHARVRPGREVLVVNVSSGGVLVETPHRLLPGSLIELHLRTADRRVSVRGRVLRCAVARLRADDLWYRGAIGFDLELPWFSESPERGYRVPAGESAAAERGEDATRLGV